MQHIVTCHGNTLLPQFLAMYRVSVDNEDTYLLVMRNMFSHRLHIHRKYDLKVHLLPHTRHCDPFSKVHDRGAPSHSVTFINISTQDILCILVVAGVGVGG